MNNIYVITHDDKLINLEAWQKIYGLDAEQIGKYFSIHEPKFKKDLADYGKLYVSELLIRVADQVRRCWGKPLTVNSFNRSDTKQASLRASGARAATTSPHVVYLAMDLDTSSVEESRKLAALILQVSKELSIKVRVGFADYIAAGQTFVHFDVTPEYYGKDKTRYKTPHPKAWETAYLTW
jgi:hypothetical protein